MKKHLFGEAVDNHYMTSRDDCRRVTLFQILVRDLTEALKIAQALWVKNASFCVLASVFGGNATGDWQGCG